MKEHDKALSAAFDGQAERFEKAPTQSDRGALARLVGFADLPPKGRILDAGCGPGLVAEVFLVAGHSVLGVDLSAEMVRRAVDRNARFGPLASFRPASVFDDQPSATFGAVVSRYVLHHVEDPRAFLRRQVQLLRPGGFLVLCDHVTDPDPERASWHQRIEHDRDQTHARNLTSGAIVDLFAGQGLIEIRLLEERFSLDFDEWFDRGTPASPKEEVRGRMLSGPGARGFRVTLQSDGSARIDCVRVLARGSLPAD